MKLYIYQTEAKRFGNIFNFLSTTNSKLYINSEGIEFRHDRGQGSISKEAFVDYAVQGSKHLEIPKDKKELKKWISSWKEIELREGRIDLVEITI